jgi:hypothetical protein
VFFNLFIHSATVASLLHTQDVHGVIAYRINPLLPRTICIVFNSYPMNNKSFAERQPFDNSSSHSPFLLVLLAKKKSRNNRDRSGGVVSVSGVYEGSGNKKKVLYLMFIGLNHVDGSPLFSFENESWSQLLLKSLLVCPRKNTGLWEGSIT